MKVMHNILTYLIITTYLLLILFLSKSVFAATVPPQVPDSHLTPGVINPEATKLKICTPNYTSGSDIHGAKIRNVPESLKKKVFAEYNIDPASDKFEIDHLISLELGGANDIKNLWPQSYTTTPYNAHMKDNLENTLHRMVCSDKINLSDAQREISNDWISAYNKYVKSQK
jgi:hypothetical protein